MAEGKREPYRDKRYAEIKREAPSLSDDEVLAAICDELDDERAELLAALQFYADEDRYDYDETCCPSGRNPGRKKAHGDVLSDNGKRARAALTKARMAMPQDPDLSEAWSGDCR